MRNILTLLVILTILGLNSCKKDSKPGACSAVWATEVEDELNALMAASVAYSMEQTAENCNAYKAASEDWLDVLRPYAECSNYSAEDRAEIQESIEAAEADLEELNCDELD